MKRHTGFDVYLVNRYEFEKLWIGHTTKSNLWKLEDILPAVRSGFVIGSLPYLWRRYIDEEVVSISHEPTYIGGDDDTCNP